MKPVKVERRKDRQKSNRKKRAKFDFADEHCIYYCTTDDVEEALMYGKEIQYRKIHLAKYEQVQGDSYIDG